MQAVRRRDTDDEMRLRRALHRRGLRYRVDWAIAGIPLMRPDVVFTNLRIAVFVDGCFWHGCPLHATESKTNTEWWRAKVAANIARDRRHDEVLTDAGWLVLRFWGHEDMEHAADVVAKAVEARRRSLGRPVRGRRPASQEAVDEDDVAEIG
jgi:DNA mismatch endonuclease, patch repair protein